MGVLTKSFIMLPKIDKVFLLDTHLSKLAGYQVELRHLVVISLHDVL